MYDHKNGISFRKITKSDLQSLLDLKSESWFGTHNIPILNYEDQERWYDSISKSKTDFILIATFDNNSVGTFKINNIDFISRVAHIGHDIYNQYRGRGLGNKLVVAGVDFCFEILNMNRLDAEVLENNIASQHTLFNAGFVKEGVRKQAVFKCQSYVDSILCGITRELWGTLDRVKEGICNKNYKPLSDK
jgi:RimJ/RimL family protein N-acetyltransferase